jgi:hypothetical protein
MRILSTYLKYPIELADESTAVSSAILETPEDDQC